MPTWEYNILVFSFDNRNWNEYLNKMGEWGYEMVTVLPHPQGYVAFFKRPAQH